MMDRHISRKNINTEINIKAKEFIDKIHKCGQIASKEEWGIIDEYFETQIGLLRSKLEFAKKGEVANIQMEIRVIRNFAGFMKNAVLQTRLNSVYNK